MTASSRAAEDRVPVRVRVRPRVSRSADALRGSTPSQVLSMSAAVPGSAEEIAPTAQSPRSLRCASTPGARPAGARKPYPRRSPRQGPGIGRQAGRTEAPGPPTLRRRRAPRRAGETRETRRSRSCRPAWSVRAPASRALGFAGPARLRSRCIGATGSWPEPARAGTGVYIRPPGPGACRPTCVCRWGDQPPFGSCEGRTRTCNSLSQVRCSTIELHRDDCRAGIEPAPPAATGVRPVELAAPGPQRCPRSMPGGYVRTATACCGDAYASGGDALRISFSVKTKKASKALVLRGFPHLLAGAVSVRETSPDWRRGTTSKGSRASSRGIGCAGPPGTPHPRDRRGPGEALYRPSV